MASTAPIAKRANTTKRHEMIKRKVNDIYSFVQQNTGFAPDYDEVIKKVSEELGYSEVTVKKILKK